MPDEMFKVNKDLYEGTPLTYWTIVDKDGRPVLSRGFDEPIEYPLEELAQKQARCWNNLLKRGIVDCTVRDGICYVHLVD